MRKVFSSNEASEAELVRDALIHHGIAATIQNEYSGHSAIPAFRPPAEVWVAQDDDYDRARQLVVDTLAVLDSNSDAPPWVCSGCREENPNSFEFCWNCRQEKSSSVA